MKHVFLSFCFFPLETAQAAAAPTTDTEIQIGDTPGEENPLEKLEEQLEQEIGNTDDSDAPAEEDDLDINSGDDTDIDDDDDDDNIGPDIC